MRTIEIGAWTPPSGTTPGIRRPVRTMTFPPISSRRIRFGEPTSPAPSGVIVAAFSPIPTSRIAAAASWTTAFSVARRFSSERSKRGKSSSSPTTSGARTRSASSSSSCPVSSPSSTTIVVASTGGDYRRAARGMTGQMARRGGWSRTGSRGRFRYVDARGERITDPDKLERIEALAIPPAWREVWISPKARRSCRPPESTPPAVGSTSITPSFARRRSGRNTRASFASASGSRSCASRCPTTSSSRGWSPSA